MVQHVGLAPNDPDDLVRLQDLPTFGWTQQALTNADPIDDGVGLKVWLALNNGNSAYTITNSAYVPSDRLILAQNTTTPGTVTWSLDGANFMDGDSTLSPTVETVSGGSVSITKIAAAVWVVTGRNPTPVAPTVTFLDEDNFASNSDAQAPTQQSVKQFIVDRFEAYPDADFTDRTGVTPASADINALLEQLNADNPPVFGALGGSGVQLTSPGGRLISGGSTLVIQGGDYRIDEPIIVFPGQRLHMLSGVRFFADPGFIGDAIIDTRPPTGGAGFGSPSSQIIGEGNVVIDGAGVAQHGIRTRVASHGEISRVKVHNCTSHGVVLGNSQYSNLSNIQSIGNGGWGFYFGKDPDVSASFGCDALLTENLFSFGNGLGGMRITDAAGGTHVNYCPSNEAAGPAVSIQPEDGLVLGHTFVGGKWEGCLYGWEVLARSTDTNARPRGIKFENVYHVLQPNGGTGSGAGVAPTYRFGINQGHGTVVVGGGSSFNNAGDWPGSGSGLTTEWLIDNTEFPGHTAGAGSPTTGGGFALAMYEQESAGGSLLLAGVLRLEGAAVSLEYVTDETGQIYDIEQRSKVLQVIGVGDDFSGTALFPEGGSFGPQYRSRSVTVDADIVKTATVNTSNSATDRLVVVLMPGTYDIDAKLFFNSNEVADFGARMNTIGGGVSNVSIQGEGIASTSANGTLGNIIRRAGLDVVLPVAGTNDGSDGMASYVGRLTVDTQTTLSLAWAQRVSDASDTTLRAGSFLRAIAV